MYHTGKMIKKTVSNRTELWARYFIHIRIYQCYKKKQKNYL